MAGRYNFQSPGAEMQNAIAEELLRRELLKRQAEQDRIAAEQRAQQAQQQQQSSTRADAQLALQQAQEARITGNQQREQSDAANARGMRLMTADAMRMPGILDNRDAMRSLAASAYGETGEVPDMLASALAPPKRTVMSVPGPEGPMRRAVSEEELIAGVPEYQEPDESQWQAAGQGVIFNPATGEFKRVPGAPSSSAAGGGAKAGAPTRAQDYTMRSKSRLLTAIDDLEPLISDKTVGTMRAKAMRAEPFLSGSKDPTVDFDAALKQITALIGFDELNSMRQASPTGGALGQVSERELTYLQSVAGSLDPNQSQPAFRDQLRKVRAEIQRVVDQGLDGAPAGRGAGGGPGPSRVQRWGRDAQGRPVRLP